MEEEKSRLLNDLSAKLDRLAFMVHRPALHLSEHFYATRNEVDYDAERLLQELGSKAAARKKAARISGHREQFIRLLKLLEGALLGELSKRPPLGDFLSELGLRIEAFTAAYFAGLDAMEETYVRLALEIIDATNKFERRLLGSQTVVYVPASDEDEIGHLVYLAEDYLNPVELACLKRGAREDGFELKNVYEEVQASLNASFAVGVTRPFVLTRSTFIIHGLVELLGSEERLASRVICVGKPPIADLNFAAKDARIVQRYLAETKAAAVARLECQTLDAIDDTEQGFERVDTIGHKIIMRGNRLTRANIRLVCGPELVLSLDLSDNRLISIDYAPLAKCVHLHELRMVNAFRSDARLDLSFLESLRSLERLHLSLIGRPDDLIDALPQLPGLQVLDLHDASSLDLVRAPARLTRTHLDAFAKLERLRMLWLTGFEMGAIEHDSLSGFRQLHLLSLYANRIERVHAEAFRNCPARLESLSVQRTQLTELSADLFAGQSALVHLSLDRSRICSLDVGCFRGLDQLHSLRLSDNSIARLSCGAFDGLASLVELDLADNRLRSLTGGLFDRLVGLQVLKLDRNPIETIDPLALAGLASRLTSLSMENCKLTSIDSAAFGELRSLRKLNLACNEIRTVEAAKKGLFSGLVQLRELSLSGNKLEKLNLACFAGLRRLTVLDVSENLIDQLNEESRLDCLVGLRRLNLAGNRLVSVAPGAFAASTGLAELDLSWNRLTGLAADFFAPFECLEKLSLRGNRLSMTINGATFSSCRRSLKELDLLNNTAISVEDGALADAQLLSVIRLDLTKSFAGLPAVDRADESAESSFDSSESLEDAHAGAELVVGRADQARLEILLLQKENETFYTGTRKLSLLDGSVESLGGLRLGERFAALKTLELTRIGLRRLETAWLTGLTSLTALDLSGNLLERLDDPAPLQEFAALEQVNLSGNRLCSIHRRLFKGLFQLSSLDLSGNQLSGIDCGPFRGLAGLKRLSLAGNGIAVFDFALLLRECRLLESLDLSNNQLDHTSVNEASMSAAASLQELMLSNNRLEKIDFVRNLILLEKLDLAQNRIQSVDSLERLVHLKHLDLSGNQIQSIGVLACLRHQLKTLDLSNNPLGPAELDFCLTRN